MIPLMLDLTGRAVLIFGGGEVGARKAAFFRHEADVTVVSRSFVPAFDDLAVRRHRTDLAGMPDDDLERLVGDAFLVVAATPDAGLNDRIGRSCRRRGVHFNNAAGEQGDVLIPSVIRGRRYLMAITTFGMSPAVPRYIRMRLEEEYGELDGMIELQGDLRAMLKETEPSQEKRSAVLWSVLSDEEIWTALASDYADARRIAEERYLRA